MEGLEYESHALAAQTRERVVIQIGERDTIDQDLAGVGLIQSRDEIEQRGLAHARFAHHGHVVAGGQVEIDVFQHDAPTRAGEGFGEDRSATPFCVTT